MRLRERHGQPDLYIGDRYLVEQSKQNLSVIFAGFEIWSGGNKATVKNFCAKVN